MSAARSDSVQVYVRVRPFIGREADTERVVHVHGDEVRAAGSRPFRTAPGQWHPGSLAPTVLPGAGARGALVPANQMVYVDGPDSGFQCNYHHAFGEAASQEQVYHRVKDCVSSVVEGFNSTLCVKAAVGCDVADRRPRAPAAPLRQLCLRPDRVRKVIHAVRPRG